MNQRNLTEIINEALGVIPDMEEKQEIQADEQELKIQALMKHLEINDRDDVEVSKWDENSFEAEGKEFMVLTDDEADTKAKEYIKDSVWAFNASFLVGYLPDGIDEDVIKILQEKCEGANEAILKMIGDNFDSFVDDAISSDGRGHFLNTYDGDEHEVGQFYIYRTN